MKLSLPVSSVWIVSCLLLAACNKSEPKPAEPAPGAAPVEAKEAKKDETLQEADRRMERLVPAGVRIH